MHHSKLLQILHKEHTSAIQLLHGDMFIDQVKAMQLQLDKLTMFHGNMKDKLTKKAVDLTREILCEQMPRARTWKLSATGA